MLTIPTRVPAPVSVATVRPPTAERVIAMQWVGVVGSAVLRTTVSVAAAQSSVVNASGAIAVPSVGTSTTTVSATATLTVVYTRAAEGSAAVTASATLRATYTRAATQSATATGSTDTSVCYTLTATQAATTTNTAATRAIQGLDATQTFEATGTTTTSVVGGTRSVTATNDTTATGAATLRDTRQLAATNTTAVTGSATTAVTASTTASNSTAVDETATLYPLHARTVTGSAATSQAATLTPAHTATQTGTVANTATLRPVYTLTATNTTSATGSAALTTAIYRDDFTGSTLNPNWQTESGYGGWTVTGTGFAQPTNNSYPKIARTLPSARTSVICEASFTTLTADPNTGAGVMLCTSTALAYAASWFAYVGTSGWQVWRNDAQVTSGSFTSSTPVSVITRITGGQFTLLINGTQVYSAAASETVYGIGLVQANTQTSTRCDWIEVRAPEVATVTASNSVTGTGTATLAATYTLAATNTTTVNESATVSAALTATQATTATASAALATTYALAATNTTTVTGIAALDSGTVANRTPNPAVANNDTGWGAYGTRTAVTGFDRAWAKQFTGTTDTRFLESAPAACGAGEQWTISATVRASDALTARVYIEFYNSTGNLLSETAVQNEALTAGTATRVYRTVTTPANTASVTMAVYFNLPATTTLLAMTMVRAVKGTDSIYRDGDSGGWTWDGTAGSSTSSGPAPSSKLPAALAFPLS